MDLVDMDWTVGGLDAGWIWIYGYGWMTNGGEVSTDVLIGWILAQSSCSSSPILIIPYFSTFRLL
jgi:hypothetical protein